MYFAVLFGLLIFAWVIPKLFPGKRPMAYHRSSDVEQDATRSRQNAPNQRVWPKLYAVFPGGWNGGGGLVHMYNLSLHRQAADWYVSSFYKSHGCRPVGEHSFNVRFSRNGTAPVRTPIGDGSGVRRLTIKFVMVPEEDRADYEGSDLRYEVKTL